MPTSVNSKILDIVLLSSDFCLGPLIEPVLQEFGASIRAESVIDRSSFADSTSFGARGELSEISHHFGPVLKLNGQEGRAVSSRIPWQHIRAIISGLDPETDGRRLKFGINKRAKPNPK